MPIKKKKKKNREYHVYLDIKEYIFFFIEIYSVVSVQYCTYLKNNSNSRIAYMVKSFSVNISVGHPVQRVRIYQEARGPREFAA